MSRVLLPEDVPSNPVKRFFSSLFTYIVFTTVKIRGLSPGTLRSRMSRNILDETLWKFVDLNSRTDPTKVNPKKTVNVDCFRTLPFVVWVPTRRGFTVSKFGLRQVEMCCLKRMTRLNEKFGCLQSKDFRSKEVLTLTFLFSDVTSPRHTFPRQIRRQWKTVILFSLSVFMSF